MPEVVRAHLAELRPLDGLGKQRVRLTSNKVSVGSPVWSPDGRRIAFVRTDARNEDSTIYVMNDDGTGVVKLTEGASPAWQPVAAP